MEYTYTYNGSPLTAPFTDVDGNRYPPNWLELSTAEDRERLGIVRTEVVPPLPPEPEPLPPHFIYGGASYFTPLATPQTAHSFTVNAPGATSVELLVGNEPYTLALDSDGLGTLEIDFAPGEISRVVTFANQIEYGFAEVIVYA